MAVTLIHSVVKTEVSEELRPGEAGLAAPWKEGELVHCLCG